MPTIDVLKYILDLDTKKFVAESQRAETQTKKLTNAIGSKLTGAITAAVTAYIGWRGLHMAADMMKIAAEAERVANSFNNIAANMGLSGKRILNELRDVSKGTISDVKLMTQASRAAIMDLPMKDLPELMKISRAAAKAFGQDTSYMFESIVLGIARQSRLILDNLGIIVNQEAVYKAETKRLGHELSEAEKKQAFFNEALKQGQSIIKAVGKDTQDYADALAQMSALWDNFIANVGKKLWGTRIGEFKELFKLIMGTYIPKMNKLYTDQDEFIAEQRKKREKELRDGLVFTITVVADQTDLWRKSLEKVAQQFRIISQHAAEIAKTGYWGRVYQPQMVESYGFPSTAQAEVEPFFNRLWFNIGEQLGQGRDLLQGAFDQIINSIDSFAGDVIRIGYDLARGDWYSAGAGIVSTIMNFFTDASDKAQRLEETWNRARQEIERNIQAIGQLTISEMESRRQAVEGFIAYYEAIVNSNRAQEQGAEYIARLNDLLDGWHRELEQINMSLENFAELQGVANFQQAIDFLGMLAGQGQLGFQQGMSLIQFFTDMFNLSIDQQTELIQTLQDLLGDNLTAEQWMQIQTSLDRLQEEGVPISTEGEYQPSQTLRSVTTITETQANLISGILNAINLEIRKLVARADSMLELMRGWTSPAGGGGGATIYLNMNITGGDGEAIATAAINEFRSRGLKVG